MSTRPLANEYVDEKGLEDRILYKHHEDGRNNLRDAFNSVIRDKITNARQGLYQTIYLTLTLKSDSLQEARSSFSSLESALRSSLIQLGINGMAGSEIVPLDIDRRMQIWYNFTHFGLKTGYTFDYYRDRDKLLSWRDTVSPLSMIFHDEYFEMNGCYGKVLYISGYPRALESDMIAELSGNNCTSYVTVSNELLDLTGFKQEVSRKHSSVGMKIENEKQRNRNKNDFLSDASDKLLSEQDSLVGLASAIDNGDDSILGC